MQIVEFRSRGAAFGDAFAHTRTEGNTLHSAPVGHLWHWRGPTQKGGQHGDSVGVTLYRGRENRTVVPWPGTLSTRKAPADCRTNP